MKHVFLSLLVLAMSVVVAHAEDKSDGCGLGWQITKKASFLATTTRGTTNAIVPPTFGMTSGTIGCEQHSFAKNEATAVIFASQNFDNLSVEMASGRGEFVSAFAQAVGCGNQEAFGSALKAKYDDMMKSKNGVELYMRVKSEMHSNAALASACSA